VLLQYDYVVQMVAEYRQKLQLTSKLLRELHYLAIHDIYVCAGRPGRTGDRSIRAFLNILFALFQLPEHHRDPFDWLLIAQCQAGRPPLVASDRLLRRYPIEVIC
jgi:hypothetical protein